MPRTRAADRYRSSKQLQNNCYHHGCKTVQTKNERWHPKCIPSKTLRDLLVITADPVVTEEFYPHRQFHKASSNSQQSGGSSGGTLKTMSRTGLENMPSTLKETWSCSSLRYTNRWNQELPCLYSHIQKPKDSLASKEKFLKTFWRRPESRESITARTVLPHEISFFPHKN